MALSRALCPVRDRKACTMASSGEVCGPSGCPPPRTRSQRVDWAPGGQGRPPWVQHPAHRFPQVLAQQGEYSEAIPILRAALKLEPSNKVSCGHTPRAAGGGGRCGGGLALWLPWEVPPVVGLESFLLWWSQPLWWQVGRLRSPSPAPSDCPHAGRERGTSRALLTPASRTHRRSTRSSRSW